MGEEIAAGREGIINLCGRTTVLEVMQYIALSDLVIGPDGGLIHLAIAQNVPFIALFSSVDPATVIPERHLGSVIRQMNCRLQPCYNEEHEPYCPFKHPVCIDIDPQLIIEKIEREYPALLADEKHG